MLIFTFEMAKWQVSMIWWSAQRSVLEAVAKLSYSFDCHVEQLVPSGVDPLTDLQVGRSR